MTIVRAATAPQRLTGLTYADLGLFLLFATYGPSFSFAGQLRYLELILLTWGLVRFSELPRRLAGQEWRLVALIALSALVHVVTGMYNDADIGDIVSRAGSHAILAALVPVLALVTRFEPRRMLAVIFGYSASYVFILYAGQAVSQNYNLMPWRLGLGMAATLAVAASFAALPKARRHAPFALAALATVHLVMGGRSLAAVTLLAAGLTALGIYTRARLPLRFDMVRTAFGIALLLAGAWIGTILMLGMAQTGLLPQELSQKVISQASHTKGLLAAARPDTVTALYALSQRPFTGFGPGVFDLDVFSFYSEITTESYANGDNFQAVYDDTVNRDWEHGIPSHSHVLGAWADAGIAAALCWLAVLFLALYVFVRASCFANPWTPLYLFVSIMTLWDVLFSPGPHRMDMAVRFLVLLMAVRHFRAVDAAILKIFAMKPFLSIVTISFNQRQFLQQTLDSVLSQKTADVEYIVVDPGSTDGSRELLQARAGQIDHLILEPDLGPADGLNKGFARARGRIGYFINSDDFLLPGAITRLREAWQRFPDAGALFAGAWIVDGDGAPLRCLDALPVSLRALLLNRTPVIQQGFSFTMDAFHKAGGFNAENRTCWDYELICGMAAKGLRLHSLPGRIGAFRLHGQGLSGGVGGAAHDARYRADIDRIKLRYSGRPRDALARLVERSGTLFKHALHPAWTLERLADATIAGRMHAKWRRDSQ